MTNLYCEKVKKGDNTAEDFTAFLHHLDGCKDCIRRIYSRIITDFKQRKTRENND